MKSDDVVGRVKTYEAIVKGQNIPKPGVPEACKVLIKELQSLGLDVKVLDINEEEIDLKQNFDDDDDIGLAPISEDFDEVAVDEEIDKQYIVEDADESDLEQDNDDGIDNDDEIDNEVDDDEIDLGLDDDDVFDDEDIDEN